MEVEPLEVYYLLFFVLAMGGLGVNFPGRIINCSGEPGIGRVYKSGLLLVLFSFYLSAHGARLHIPFVVETSSISVA